MTEQSKPEAIDYNELYMEAVTIGESSRLTSRQTHLKSIADASECLANLCLRDVKNKIMDAAKSGKKRANLYKAPAGAKYKNHPIGMLLFGPHKEGMKFFEEEKIKPTVQYLDEHFAGSPFKCNVKIIENRTMCIDVEWN